MDVLLSVALAYHAEHHADEFSPPELTKTAWAFSAAAQLDTPLLVVFAKAFERRVNKFDARELANVAWVFTTAGR